MRTELALCICAILLAACSPAPAESPAVGEAPPAIGFISESYPTAQAQVAVGKQSAGGIDVRLDGAWMDGKNLNANVCFTLPDASDWGVWAASLNYAGSTVQEYGTTLVSYQEPVEGQAGSRCDVLTFIVPPDADLTNATISIDAIAAPPRADDYCSLYMPKIQQALLERGIGITLDCVDVNGTATLQITGRPPEMSQEDAELIVFSDEFYSLRGPWTFALSVTQ